ncbi:MAG: glycogen/starch synthase [Spirochaetes bacterium]|nr:glycogen/starch synthase [Spirochaetota bacterium]
MDSVQEKKFSRADEICGLCRFSLKEEEFVKAKYVKAEILNAFNEKRCFSFYPDESVIINIKGGTHPDLFKDRFIEIKNKIFTDVAEGDNAFYARMMSDSRLSNRIVNAVTFIHLALARGEYKSLFKRRFVIIKELAGKPTFYHYSKETTVISHVGQGPVWAELPTVYLGLKTFDTLEQELKYSETELFKAFMMLLSVEERAIETGFSHRETYGFDFSVALNKLVDAVIAYTSQTELRVAEEAVKKEVQAFSVKMREKYLHLLDARRKGDMLNFDYESNLKGIDGLAKLAKRYKSANDKTSLHEVIKLLVSASGHDIHEIRNRANIILERVFAPKEYDAPLTTTFINIHAGDNHRFSFKIADNKNTYFLRIYRNACDDYFFVDNEIDYKDVDLHYIEQTQRFETDVKFEEYGHYDFVVLRKKLKLNEWIDEYGTSGRVNVIPDIRGEMILEIFADIHGHTGAYWRDESGHPGLVYNENGEVIRLGRFSDIAAHIPDLKERYRISAIYILGVQKRGTHSEDWAPGATSPSPFSPISLTEIEDFLGGASEFKELVKEAHRQDIKVIVDCIPHVNRHSDELSPENIVYCYDGSGNIVQRSSTDGKYGSWDDGKLLNYRRFQVWEWLVNSIETLIREFDIDGIRFDSAHAVPIMMKKNNFPLIYDKKRNVEEMVEGRIIVNDRWDDAFITTGYYDCQCRDMIAIPFHNFLMSNVQRMLRRYKKNYFIHIAECFWGHERFLSRSGIIPYNASLFKIMENIVHGKSDAREVYHIYDNYYPSVLCKGTELLGILGNHDERRAMNTFGHRGLRASIGLTIFMSNIVMDYEGSAEGEGWKVFLDNIYVNWNQFEYASHRSVDRFYREMYDFHRKTKGKGQLVWANNNMVAAAVKKEGENLWVGAFNFADSNQTASIQFDNPALNINDDVFFKVVDPLYSSITGHYSYFTGKELKVSHINTIVPFTDRVKMLRLEKIDKIDDYYTEFIKDSFFRLCSISVDTKFMSNFAFSEIAERIKNISELERFIKDILIPLFWEESNNFLKLGLKRVFYHIFKNNLADGNVIFDFSEKLAASSDLKLNEIGKFLIENNRGGSLIFMSSEADPFSKSGGLANVVYELPRELVKAGEKVFVITGYYRCGDSKAVSKMNNASKKYNCRYTGRNVRFKIMDQDYEVGVHFAEVEGIGYYLLDHHELFDGLYWGVTSEEKLRRRIGFARACAEVICTFGLMPLFTFTNDAFAGLFNGIVRSDHTYYSNPNFERTTYLHIVHNGGWQYFDAYNRYEKGFDLFRLFNLPEWKAGDFCDPVFWDRINSMAAGIRFADRAITVSPSYAKQIEYQSDGLEHILKNVIGISNAIGKDLRQRIQAKFDQSGFVENNYKPLITYLNKMKPLKEKISKRYPEIMKSPEDVYSIKDDRKRAITTRVMNKMMLQLERGLDVDPDRVLFTMIHRITEQKGFGLLLDASEGIFKQLNFQGIIGGAIASGDKTGEEQAHGLWLLSQYYNKSANVGIGFQDVAVPLLSSDIFCMPSMNEPGGISQLEAFACGCLVVARATGGLRDTVHPIHVDGNNVEGNGFLFMDYTAWGFYDAMERAHRFLTQSGDDIVYKARVNAEESLFFWDTPARKYIEEIYNLKEIIRIIK